MQNFIDTMFQLNRSSSSMWCCRLLWQFWQTKLWWEEGGNNSSTLAAFPGHHGTDTHTSIHTGRTTALSFPLGNFAW